MNTLYISALSGSTLVCRVITLLELSEVPLIELIALSVRIQLALRARCSLLVDSAAIRNRIPTFRQRGEGEERRGEERRGEERRRREKRGERREER